MVVREINQIAKSTSGEIIFIFELYITAPIPRIRTEKSVLNSFKMNKVVIQRNNATDNN